MAQQNFAEVLVEKGRGSALINPKENKTYMVSEVPRWAAAWQNTGLEPGDRVIIVCDLSPQSALAYLGIIYGGYVAVPIDVRDFYLNYSRLKIKSGAKAAWLPHVKYVEHAASEEGAVYVGRDGLPERTSIKATSGGSKLAVLMQTSGSTGTPRLVEVSHENLLSNTAAIVKAQGLTQKDRAMLVLSISYCFGASILHSHIFVNGDVVLDSRFMFPNKVLQACQQYACTTFAGVPTVFKMLLQKSKIAQYQIPSLNKFLQAGGSLDEETIHTYKEVFPHACFFVMYGQTEATARITTRDSRLVFKKNGNVGKPLSHIQMKIISDTGRELPLGEWGQVCVSGPSICSGYWEEATATTERFKDGWLLTGDIGSLESDGSLQLKGRIDRFAKIRGRRVSLKEVELKIESLASIKEAAAVSVEHPTSGESLGVAVVSFSDTDKHEVKTQIFDQIPKNWDIGELLFVDEIPTSVNGKIDYQALLRDVFK